MAPRARPHCAREQELSQNGAEPPTKSHVVVAKEGDKVARSLWPAGRERRRQEAKDGGNRMNKRASHSRRVALSQPDGARKMSAAYWANKEPW